MKQLLLLLSTIPLLSNSITIYNNNLAHIQESRVYTLKKGLQNIEFKNLPSSIIVDSISPTFSKSGVKLISQNYTYSPLTVQNLLKANLNKEVEFFYKDKKKLLSGKLINLNPTVIESQGSYYIVNGNDIVFKNLPEHIDIKPKLEWQVESKKDTKTDVELSYLINQISWSSNYTLSLSKDTLSLKAWAKIRNKSGKAYKENNISLIAGEVNSRRLMQPRNISYKAKTLALEADAAVIAPKRLSGYYIYDIPYKIELNNNQTKQIALIDANGVKYKRYGVAYNRNFNNYLEAKLAFSQVIEFKNSKDNNLGLPLPQGLVRVYKGKHYLGEDSIKNSAIDEKIKLNIGTLFDVVGTKKISKFITHDNYRDVETSYSIKNRGKKSITIKVTEAVQRYGKKINFKTTCKDDCKVKKQNAFTRVYSIKLKPKQEYKFKTEYEIFY